MAMFVISLVLKEIGEFELAYKSIDECLSDDGMRALFEADQVIECLITQNGRLISKIPESLASWTRFESSLISHATSLLRGGASHTTNNPES